MRIEHVICLYINIIFYNSLRMTHKMLLIYVFQIINIQEIESAMHALLVKQAMIFMKRRQDELKHESAYLQQLSR